jgi:hypothetical protein
MNLKGLERCNGISERKLGRFFFLIAGKKRNRVNIIRQ